MNIMRWYFPAEMMGQDGVMCVLIGQCRFGRLTGGVGIEDCNPHVPLSSNLLQKPTQH
jgi:hypothetical protein